MFWRFMIVNVENNLLTIKYNYETENNDLDGIIKLDLKSLNTEIIKLSESDKKGFGARRLFVKLPGYLRKNGLKLNKFEMIAIG